MKKKFYVRPALFTIHLNWSPQLMAGSTTDINTGEASKTDPDNLPELDAKPGNPNMWED